MIPLGDIAERMDVRFKGDMGEIGVEFGHISDICEPGKAVNWARKGGTDACIAIIACTVENEGRRGEYGFVHSLVPKGEGPGAPSVRIFIHLGGPQTLGDIVFLS